MKSRYIVEYSEDLNEVCIIPESSISIEEFYNISKILIKKGYKWWLPADQRRGYVYCKELKSE